LIVFISKVPFLVVLQITR